jgi:hypothetical protein
MLYSGFLFLSYSITKVKWRFPSYASVFCLTVMQAQPLGKSRLLFLLLSAKGSYRQRWSRFNVTAYRPHFIRMMVLLNKGVATRDLKPFDTVSVPSGREMDSNESFTVV